MKKMFIAVLALTSLSSFAVENVSLSEEFELGRDEETKNIVEGRLWAEATKTCIESGATFAVQSGRGFIYRVLRYPNSNRLRLGGSANFECVKR